MASFLTLFGCCGPRKKEKKIPTETTPLLEDPSEPLPTSASPEPPKNPQDELAAKWAAIAGTGERTLSSMNANIIRSPSLRSQSLHSEDTSIAGGLSPLPPRDSLALPSEFADDESRSPSSLVPDAASLPPLSPPPSTHTSPDKTSKKKKSSSKFKAPTEW